MVGVCSWYDAHYNSTILIGCNMTALFFICTGLVFWAYIGYPVSMYLLARFRPTMTFTDPHHTPMVSVIIAVAGAGARIYDKLCNTLDTNYPLANMEVIVALDGECEETREHVNRFIETYFAHKNRVRVVVVVKSGKETAQQAGIRSANHEICVFTDLGTELKGDAIHKLVRHFYDDNVGAVDGISTVKPNGNHSNEGLYLRYEGKIREWESKTTGLVGTGGCLFAARRSFLLDTIKLYDIGGFAYDYKGFVTDQPSDFRTALVMRTWGLKTVLDRQAIALFEDGKPNNEFKRKHRTIVRGINAFLHSTHLLNPFKYGLFSYALFCHKLLKWLVPFFLLGALVSNTVLAVEGGIWLNVFVAHAAFIFLSAKNMSNKLGKIMYFFLMSNTAIFFAWVSYLRGERYVTWEPTKR